MAQTKFQKTLLFLGLFLIIAILVISGVYIYFSNEKKEVEIRKRDELKSISALKIKQISDWYTNELSTAQIIANDNSIVNRVGKWISENTRFNSGLKQISQEHRYYSVIIFSIDFSRKISSDENKAHIDSITLALSKSALRSRAVISTDLYRCSLDGNIYLDFIAPVLDENREPIAVIIFRHNPKDFLFPLVQNWPVPSKTSETLILRKEAGNVVFLNDLRHVDSAALKLTIPITEKNSPAVFAATGNSGFIDGYDYKKHRVLAYTDSVQGTPWYFVAKVDYQEMFDNIYFKSSSPIVTSVVIIVMLFLTFYFFYINQQKINYKKLNKSQQEFKTTLYSIGDAVITTDSKGKVQYLNPVAEKLTGWTEQEAEGRPIEEVFVIINEEKRETVVNPVKIVVEKGQIVGLANHTLLISRQGDEIPIADSGAPIFDERGSIAGVVLVFRDQSIERKQQKAIIESRQMLENLLSNLPGMAFKCHHDADCTMEFVSNGCKELTGYSPWEIEQNHVISYSQIIHPDDRLKVMENVSAALASHSAFQTEYRIIMKNGETKWVWGKGQGNYNDDGELTFFEGFISDIDKRKIAEDAIQDSEHLFKTLAENATVGIFKTSSSGLTTYVNPEWCKLTGMEIKHALNKKWTDQIHSEDREQVAKDWEIDFAGLATSKAEFRFTQPDGNTVWVKGQSVPEFNNQGKFLGYIGTFTDITESIKASDTLHNANKILRTIIENIPDAVYMKDLEGRKLIANKADVENCGFNSEEELIGKNDFDMFPEEIAANFWEGDKQVLQKGIPVLQREEKLVNQNKKIKWILTSKIPFKDNNGKIIGLVGIGYDITRRKNNEEEMLKLTKVISQSPVSIVITNPEGNIEYVNPKFTEVTGYSYDEVIGKNPRLLKSGTQTNEFYSEMWNSILSGNDWKSEFHNKKKNGELFWENVIISPIFNEKGDIINFVAVKEDITEKKKMVEELISAKIKAEESDRLKSSFLANMSHEIRTPLNSILGFSNFLTNHEIDFSDEEKKEFSNIINKSAEGLLQIINDIIDISSLETGQLKTFYTQLKVNSIVKSLHTVFSLKLIEINKSHLFLTLLTASEEVTIYADENRFIQILTNLLSNALKFTQRGEIIFGVENFDDNIVSFIVSDTGIGIRPEMQTSIFERFRQGEEDTTRSFGGNGLGLSIVKNLIELMGGELSLESELGKGSKFRFWLPRIAK